MQQHMCKTGVPVSYQLIDDMLGDIHTYVNPAAQHKLIEFIQEKYGNRYFVAAKIDEQRHESPDTKRRGLIYFIQTWIVTLH